MSSMANTDQTKRGFGTGAGRPRLYASDAERQRTWRQRQKDIKIAKEPVGGD